MYNSFSRGNYGYDNRTGFVFPFLVGAVTGGAAVGLTRPRPIFVNPGYTMPYQPYQPYPYYSNYYGYYPRPF